MAVLVERLAYALWVLTWIRFCTTHHVLSSTKGTGSYA